jgi:hypothetical protein
MAAGVEEPGDLEKAGFLESLDARTYGRGGDAQALRERRRRGTPAFAEQTDDLLVQVVQRWRAPFAAVMGRRPSTPRRFCGSRSST